jgi:adenine-specific DNA methylase
VTERRLIEEALPLEEVNAASAREKTLRHGHISTMHLWWARRPLAMSRAVVLATLLPEPGNDSRRQEILDLISQASEFESASDPSLMNPLRRLLADAYPDGPPKVLDCFAGGGAIPLEALRLGCETTALEINPVAHLIEKGCLEYPQRYGKPDPVTGKNHLGEDFLYWAGWLREHVRDDLAAVFPANKDGKRPAVYFWCRTMRCSNNSCARIMPLVSSRWLANSKSRKAWIEFHSTASAISVTVHTAGTPADNPAEGTIRASSATCPACGTTIAASDVREYGKKVQFGAQLYAVCDIDGRSRTYRVPTKDEVDGAFVKAASKLEELPDLDDGTSAVPDESITKSQFRILRSLVYGIDTFAGMFNVRQRYVLGRLARGVREAHAEMLNRGLAAEYARAVATYLGFLVDRTADYNSSFCGWQTTREFVRNTFPRQAIAMVWDHTEIDPFGESSGNWSGAVRWIELAIRHCSSSSDVSATVIRGNAQAQPFADETFDAVISDPPYYDAIQYGDLSDFFFVWLKRSVSPLYPDLFLTPLTPKQQEIIENRADKKSAEYVSHEEFERRLQAALSEMSRVTKREGLVAIVFAHTDIEAWEHLLRGLRAVDLVVTTSWPMRSEMASRQTASISAVLGSCVVLVCRKELSHGEGFYDDVVRELEQRIAQRLDRFDAMGLVGADYFASAVGPAFEVFAKYSRVIRLSGDEVDIPELMTLARQVVARRALGKLLGDEAIGSLDAVSLLYLTWRWAYDGESIPADEAYKLERALDVDLSSLGGPEGLAEKSGATFALRGPDERRGLKFGTTPSMIDVMHVACLLWDAGRRQELEAVLGETGMGTSTAFWSLARALAEVLPDGNRERTLLLGLSGNQENLSAAAASAVVPRSEQPELSWGGPEQETMFTVGTEQPRLGEETP